MNSHTRRRDDRSAPPADPFKQWVPTSDKYPLDHDSERRRNRSTTLPSHSYDPRSNPSHDPRYNDPRLPSRSHRQDPHYPPASSYPYHQSTAHAPSTTKAYQHATRSSAQHASSGHHYPQPSSYQPSNPTPAYHVASSSRRQHTDAPDPGASRRPPPSTHQSPYDQLSPGDDMPRSSARPSRAIHTSLQPSYSAPANQTFWNPTQESSSRRHKDAYRDRGKEQDRERDREREREKEKERERDKSTAELENRYKDRARAERYRERERERATEVRHQESSRSRHHDRRKDPDTEGVLYSEQRNASKPSLSGKEAYSSSIREPGNGHRRYRTEDGTASIGRRHQPENTQNPITPVPPHSTTVSPADVQQTGDPPPAPRVMPVYLPPKGKSQRSHRDGRPSTAQGAQSGSDTERATGKHRMERTPSGPAVQRSDAHTSTSARDRGNHDLQMGPRDDVKRLEGKYRAHSDTRQPLAQINVDIPLVTPGFNASALPADTKTSTAPQIVSIRAGQGPSDPHDAHFKSSAISHSTASQETVHPLHSSASIVKSSGHTRSYPSEVRAQSDRLPITVENSRTEPHADDLPPGPRVSIHESSRAFPTPIPKPYARGNPETAVDMSSSSYPHSRPPSRSAHRTSANNTVPPAVVGPRPLRSLSQGPQTSEPLTSVTHHVSTVSSVPNQHSVPPSPAHPINSSPPKARHSRSSLSSVQPSPKYVQLHGVSPSHSISTQQAPSVLPSVHPTPIVAPRALSSRPPTQDGLYADAPYVHLQPTNQQPATSSYPESQHTSNGTTVKASWVVETPATAKRTNISREDKYLRDHNLDLETRQAQLRQVLSQDNEPFRRASSSMMKISQATTPSALSQRNSPGTKGGDVSFGTPRGTSTGNSPKPGSAKEAPTPEHVLRQNLPHLAAPPQITVVGSTPVTTASALPQGRVDHALLAPPFPAPTRVSRTTSSSQDQFLVPSQPAVRNTPPTSYQSQLVPVVHVPSLFQPYQPPSPPAPEDGGQFSPPPLPVPPPRGLEDSPPLAIETRTSEILATRSHSAGDPESDVRSVPEVQSEMFHIPSQLPSMVLPRTTQPWQPSQGTSNTVLAAISNGPVIAAHSDARSQNRAFDLPDDVPVAHQEIMRSVSVVPPHSFAPARPRPKVMVEDVPEDTLVLSKGIPANIPITPSFSASRPAQPSQDTTVSNVSSTSKSAVLDPPGHKSSPLSKSKDPLLHRNNELTAMSTAPPMPAPIPTRVPSSAPPIQPALSLSSHAAPAQRATSHVVSSRTSQRAAEMSQASKFATSAGAGPGATGNVGRSTIAPIQTTHNPVSTTTNQPQPPNAVSVQGPLASRPVNTPTTTTAPPNISVLSMPKAAMLPTPGSGPSIGALGPHASGSSNSTQPSFAPDPFRHQPSRPGPVSIPTLDATSTTTNPTAPSKSAHPEQHIPESTRSREVAPPAIRNAAPSHVYPNSTRPGPSSAITQQTPVTQAQPSTHYRTVSLPVTTSSSAVQKPPSPRKYSQPISSTTVSTQPFPSRPSAPEPQSARVAISGHLSVPVPVRSARLSPPHHTSDFDMLKTPSSIAPSPMLNPDSVPQSIAIPIRARQTSTDSKDDKKKASGLFGLFRTRTLSSKAADPPTVSSVSGASPDQGRAYPDASVVPSVTTPVPRGATSTLAPKELHSAPPPVASTTTRTVSQSKLKSRVPDSVAIPPKQAAREHKETTPHLFTPFKFLTMNSKRNRTVSAASLDVCDGYTATTTVIGSPDHSTVSQAQTLQPLPGIVPPGIRDPLVATSEWRDREEADRRELRTHRIRRPGVTFDLEEEPPSPAPGTASKRKKLVRRPSGRTPTPGPPRG